MSAHDRAIGWLTDRIEASDDAYGRDVALTTRELCRDASPVQRCLELLSLVTLALRLGARRCDRPDAVWRQGVYAGALLLLASLAAENAAAGWGDTGKFGLAVMLAAAIAGALRGRLLAAVAVAAAAATVEAAWVSHGIQAGAFVSACVVAIGGLLAGGDQVVRPRHGIALGLAIVLGGFLSGLLVGAGSAEAATVLVLAWIVPAGLLLAGWFDPRLAAAATTIVFARLAASGFGELGRALAVLQMHGQRQLLLRWLAMGSSVVAAWLVTHRSIRRIGRF